MVEVMTVSPVIILKEHHYLARQECGILAGAYPDGFQARMLKTKSVGSVVSRKDGLRILVTRFRGRGLPASRYDVWMPSLSPSERLLDAFRTGTIVWSEFSRCYKRELFAADPADINNRHVKNHGQKFTLRLIKRLAESGQVTLMCHCGEEEPHCHRHLLADLVRRI